MQSIQKSLITNNASDVPGNSFGEPSVEVNRSMENVVLPLSGIGSRKISDSNEIL